MGSGDGYGTRTLTTRTIRVTTVSEDGVIHHNCSTCQLSLDPGSSRGVHEQESMMAGSMDECGTCEGSMIAWMLLGEGKNTVVRQDGH